MTKLFDLPVFNFINHTMSNHFFDKMMPLISRFGGGELYFLIGLIFLLSKKRELKSLGVALLAALTFSYYISGALKIFTARPRPFIAFTNVILLGDMPKAYSFPSGHAVYAFAVATLLTGRFKKHGVIFYSLAALVAFSRVYMGAHYPSDVLIGAAIGIMIGMFLEKVDKYLADSR